MFVADVIIYQKFLQETQFLLYFVRLHILVWAFTSINIYLCFNVYYGNILLKNNIQSEYLVKNVKSKKRFSTHLHLSTIKTDPHMQLRSNLHETQLIKRNFFENFRADAQEILRSQSRTLTFKKICFACFNESPFKMMGNVFISSQKLFSSSRYLNFFLDFSVIQKKRLDQKDMVNFKISDVTTWLTNNFNTHIGQYLTK